MDLVAGCCGRWEGSRLAEPSSLDAVVFRRHGVFLFPLFLFLRLAFFFFYGAGLEWGGGGLFDCGDGIMAQTHACSSRFPAVFSVSVSLGMGMGMGGLDWGSGF